MRVSMEFLSEISIVVPVHNAGSWLEECLLSLLHQTYSGCLELSIFNDASTDNSMTIIENLKPALNQRGIQTVISGHDNDKPKGVGYAKNKAVRQSKGKYICFLDADDVMEPRRVAEQYQAALSRPNAIIGCQFRREPKDSTERFTRWCNTTSPAQLYTQAYTSHGPTVAMPTWFCSREVFDKVGGFDESGKGTPEDLIFFFRHLELGGALHRVDECLMMYRYHPNATTHSIHRDTIWSLRVRALQDRVLSHWPSFTIWSAGKQGKKFYRCLSPENQKKLDSLSQL